MRSVRNIILLIGLIMVLTRITERYVLQPKLNNFIIQHAQDNQDKVVIDSMQFDGPSVQFAGVKIKGSNDSFNLIGSLQPSLLGWPSIKFDLLPSESKIWNIRKIQGKIKLWLNEITANRIIISDLKLLRTPTFAIPQTFISFDYNLSNPLTHITIEIPQFGPSSSAGQIYIKGDLNPKDHFSGKLSVRIVNPVAVLNELSQTDLITKQQLSAVNGLIMGLSNNKAEITLPLSIEKWALYLGPIRLYPKSSRDDNLARIGEGVMNNLFRAFGKLPQ